MLPQHHCGGNRRLFSYFFPQVPVTVIAIGAYIIFTGLNIYGVKAAATLSQYYRTGRVELLIFAGATLPHFELKNIQHNAFPFGWKGVWAAIPCRLVFLAIEGVANVAEEAINPQRNVLLGFGSAL